MSRKILFLKIAVHALCLWPLAGLLLGFKGWLGFNLTANPVERITLITGGAALLILVWSLAVTPIRKLSGWNDAIKFRRLLGLYAFFYALLHFATYLALDKQFAWGEIGRDLTKRRFIIAGLTALLLMLPLALTSTRGWIRRLGRNWTRLHWLAYPALIAALVHFIWKVKVIDLRPLGYAAAIALLLGFRIFWALRERMKKPVRHL